MARCSFAAIPFWRIPNLLTAELIYLCTFWINCRCFRVGVLSTISPRELLTGIKCDYSIQGKFQFGDYLQAYCGTDNTTQERSNNCIYTRPCGNLQGGFFIYDLKTLERTHCYLGSVLPMPESVIKLFEDITRKERCPDGLDFTSGDGTQTILNIANPMSDTLDDADSAYQPSDASSVDTALTGVISSLLVRSCDCESDRESNCESD